MKEKIIMKKFYHKYIGLLLASMMLLLQTGCSLPTEEPFYQEPQFSAGYMEAESSHPGTVAEESSFADAESSFAETESSSETEILADLPIEGESYYDVENVVLYLYLYEELPDNYITKSEAGKLGWEGGSVEKYKEGAAIGGDRFGNREGLLPKDDGRTYTECDIDTDGAGSRGAKRLVFSNDGLYYYTEDHYESFDEVTVTDDYEVIW